MLPQSRCNEGLSRLQMSEGLQYTFLQLAYRCLSSMLCLVYTKPDQIQCITENPCKNSSVL